MQLNPLTRTDPLPHAARDASPLPAAAPAHGDASAAPFAKLLRQSQAAPPAQPPAHPPESNAGADAPSPAPDGDAKAAPEADATAKAHAPARPKQRSPDKAAAPSHRPLRADAASKVSDGDTAKTATNRDAAAATPAPTATPTALVNASASASAEANANANATPTFDPALAAWLAALQSAPVGLRGDGHAHPGGTAPAASDSSDPAGGPTSATADLRAALSDPTDPTGRAAPGKARAAPPATEAAAIGPRAELTGARPAAAEPVLAERSDSLPGLNAAAFTPAPGALREAPPPTAVALATPVDAPEFGRTLGLQVSVLAQGGVQQAELHLNPADMGPVSVQIVMDGSRAQVDFGADVAATRHAIEAGLPELASALRDAGFTLTGGGVSQHSRGRSHDGADGRAQAARSTRRVSADDLPDLADAARAATRRTVRLGGLDLYA